MDVSTSNDVYNPIPPSIGIPLIVVLVGIIVVLSLLYRFLFVDGRLCPWPPRKEKDKAIAAPVKAYEEEVLERPPSQSRLSTLALSTLRGRGFGLPIYNPTAEAEGRSADSATQTASSELGSSDDADGRPGQDERPVFDVRPAEYPGAHNHRHLTAPRSTDLYAVPDKSPVLESRASPAPTLDPGWKKKTVRFGGSSRVGEERASPPRLDPSPLYRIAADDLETCLDPRADPQSYFNRGIKP